MDSCGPKTRQTGWQSPPMFPRQDCFGTLKHIPFIDAIPPPLLSRYMAMNALCDSTLLLDRPRIYFVSSYPKGLRTRASDLLAVGKVFWLRTPAKREPELGSSWPRADIKTTWFHVNDCFPLFRKSCCRSNAPFAFGGPVAFIHDTYNRFCWDKAESCYAKLGKDNTRARRNYTLTTQVLPSP